MWIGALGDDVVVGIEGSGSYGAGLCEFLLAEGFMVVEVERPKREARRRGKSDDIDALAAAKKVLGGGEGLRTRGHEVCWATGPDGFERVKRAGFDVVSVGLCQAERQAQFARRHPEIYELPPQERPDFMFGKLFGEISAQAALADLLPARCSPRCA